MENKKSSTFATLLCCLMANGIYLNLESLLTQEEIKGKATDKLVKTVHFDTIET
ncbi:hypothetical protein [Leuconostoc rapi]|uniref:hypothetical protein n=1 Tax=Leuconostoc rapi TaxID=1406906 RepID=UPI00195AC734|nr:hypothetical protein [Leuconostoc rapi]MBM7436285.1 hypothetical protein [Leuconostoc rapi]